MKLHHHSCFANNEATPSAIRKSGYFIPGGALLRHRLPTTNTTTDEYLVALTFQERENPPSEPLPNKGLRNANVVVEFLATHCSAHVLHFSSGYQVSGWVGRRRSVEALWGKVSVDAASTVAEDRKDFQHSFLRTLTHTYQTTDR